jgi:hypothetical protein
MTSNDAQIDVLLRRFAGQSQGNPATEHLDADELNSFAEGALPEAARSRYMSHLADCDDCRQIVSQLAMSSGAVLAAEAPRAAPAGYSWWKRMGGFFSPMTLRYAAFAMVLVTVAGVVFLITRRPRDSSLIAQNEPAKQDQVEAHKAPDNTSPRSSITDGTTKPSPALTNPQGLATPSAGKPDALKSDQPGAPPPRPEQEVAGISSPARTEKKTAEPEMAKSQPAYAPLPPVESQRAESMSSRERLDSSNIARGPRKSEPPSDKFKMMDRSRAGEMPKDVDDRRPAEAAPQSARKRSGDDEKEAGRGSDSLSSRDRNTTQSRARGPANQIANQTANQTAGTANQAQANEETPQTRSTGGRKFRREGNSWVDTKFKSSMPVKSISRGSSEFDALESGLRSIAQQLGGQVLVVWKNKAYLIH